MVDLLLSHYALHDILFKLQTSYKQNITLFVYLQSKCSVFVFILCVVVHGFCVKQHLF